MDIELELPDPMKLTKVGEKLLNDAVAEGED